jgi:anti-sigma regulatory factor (Ser/Thr protein kinase)
VTSAVELSPNHDGFRHEAFIYAGEKEFVAGATAFLRAGVRAKEPALVVVSGRKIDLLRQGLKADAGKVTFADMGSVGVNPARIIPAWAEFVAHHEGRRLRGIGEPIWAERGPDELVECQRHESLLNVAFAGHDGFTLMCPYDTENLDRDVLAEARRSHPFIRRHGAEWFSDDYLGTDHCGSAFSQPLPEPPASAVDLVFQTGSLREMRSLVLEHALHAGLGRPRADDAVAAVNEVVSNTMRHGGGQGRLRIWTTTETLVCEVSDDGHLHEPLVGRVRPELGTSGGRGLWMVNQLCELVQVRSWPTGTTIRMHLRRECA